MLHSNYFNNIPLDKKILNNFGTSYQKSPSCWVLPYALIAENELIKISLATIWSLLQIVSFYLNFLQNALALWLLNIEWNVSVMKVLCHCVILCIPETGSLTYSPKVHCVYKSTVIWFNIIWDKQNLQDFV